MVKVIEELLEGFAKLALVAAGAFYAVLVLVRYANEGPRYELGLDAKDRVRSAERFAVWLGIKAVSAAVRFGKLVLEFFSEPSAEVGDWLISKSPLLQRVIIRSRSH